MQKSLIKKNIIDEIILDKQEANEEQRERTKKIKNTRIKEKIEEKNRRKCAKKIMMVNNYLKSMTSRCINFNTISSNEVKQMFEIARRRYYKLFIIKALLPSILSLAALVSAFFLYHYYVHPDPSLYILSLISFSVFTYLSIDNISNNLEKENEELKKINPNDYDHQVLLKKIG